MEYYIFVEDGKINGCGQARQLTEGVQNIEVSQEIFENFLQDRLLYVWNGSEIIANPNYETDKQAQIRAEKDMMILTPSDVERALLKAKGMDYEDLKIFLKNEHGYTDAQIKAIGVELRAKDFFRGATMGEEPNQIRIVDTIGALLDYNSDDMDYLFEHKELPNKSV